MAKEAVRKWIWRGAARYVLQRPGGEAISLGVCGSQAALEEKARRVLSAGQMDDPGGWEVGPEPPRRSDLRTLGVYGIAVGWDPQEKAHRPPAGARPYSWATIVERLRQPTWVEARVLRREELVEITIDDWPLLVRIEYRAGGGTRGKMFAVDPCLPVDADVGEYLRAKMACIRGIGTIPGAEGAKVREMS